MNTIREVQKINERELELGIAGTSATWHAQYSQSAWIYIGNIDHALSEGDLLCVLSQFGEIDDLHLARDDEGGGGGGTGKSKGFCFCKYEDARSCILAVDNLCGIQLCGRSLRIDHVENYRLPKHLLEKEEAATSESLDLTQPGLAYVGKELANDYTLDKGQDLFAPPPPAHKTTKANDTTAATEKHDKDDDQSNSKEAKLRRKEERQWKRLEKEKRNRAREEHEVEREERRRERRARRMRQRSSGSSSIAISSPDDDSRKRHRDVDVDDGEPEKKNHKEEHHRKKKHKKHHKHHADDRSTSRPHKARRRTEDALA